ncbi:MAG: hypothetical protein QM757_43700 [Paludibaculum sp.]
MLWRILAAGVLLAPRVWPQAVHSMGGVNAGPAVMLREDGSGAAREGKLEQGTRPAIGATSAEPSEPLSLDKALALAEEHNPQLKAAAAMARGAQGVHYHGVRLPESGVHHICGAAIPEIAGCGARTVAALQR